MKRLAMVMLVLSFLVASAGMSLAADKKKKVMEVKTPTLSDQERAALQSNAVTTLNSQAWTIYLTALGAKKSKVETDVLTFSGTGMVSQNLSAKGFGGSNYSMHVLPDSAVVFETVQRTENDDIAAWRGELREGNIYGTVSIKYKSGASVGHAFSTVMPVMEPEPVQVQKKR